MSVGVAATAVASPNSSIRAKQMTSWFAANNRNNIVDDATAGDANGNGNENFNLLQHEFAATAAATADNNQTMGIANHNFKNNSIANNNNINNNVSGSSSTSIRIIENPLPAGACEALKIYDSY